MSLETEYETIPLHVEFNKELGNPLYIPFAKDAVDTSHRIIKGYATTEALDREGQIVTKDAVAGALDEYLAVNPTLRADHRPPPIGKTILADMDKKGLLVHARINKNYQAAEDAWSAILQGAYNAFSIGGLVKEARREFDKDLDQQVTKISKITISEISVTDAPANPECSFEVLHKSITKQVMDKDLEFVLSYLDSLAKEQFPEVGGSRFEGCVQHFMRTKGLPRENAEKLCAYIGRRAGKIKDVGSEVGKMSETEIEKQEPTEEGQEAPTIEERVAKLEQMVAEILERLQGGGETEASATPPVTASLSDVKGLVKELVKQVEPVLAKSISEKLGITQHNEPIQKSAQETVIGDPATPQTSSEKDEPYTLRDQILDQMGYEQSKEEA